jgi:hypothetical protein
VSDFLGNLARRGAGLAPGVAPRLAMWRPPPRVRLPNMGAPFSEAALEGDDAPAQVEPRPVPAASNAPRAAGVEQPPAGDPAALSSAPMIAPAPMPAPSPRIPLPLPAPEQLQVSQPVPPSEWPAREPQRPDAVPAMTPCIPDREPRVRLHSDAVAVEPPLLRPAPAAVQGQFPRVSPSGPTMAAAPTTPPDRTSARARPVAADAIPLAARERASAALSTRAPVPETPSIHVRIGRVEVRAPPQASAPVRPAQPKGGSGFAELSLARAHLDRTWR